MQQFNRDGLTFDVTDEGPPDAPVIVLLHGYPDNRGSWARVSPRLAAAGFRVLAPDQRGYSPGARPQRRRDYTIDKLADDVLALIDASGADRVHLVGHDWGGAVSWAVATAHPDRLITVTSLATPHPRAFVRSLVSSTQAFRSWYMALYQLPWLPERMVGARDGRVTCRALVRSGLSASAAEGYVDALRQPGAARAAINWYRGMVLSRPVSGKVRVPTLYVYATGDRFLSRRAAKLTGRYVDAPYRLETLEGASHWLPEESADVVARLILDHAASAAVP